VLHDIEKRLPFEDGSAEHIYCSHALEHCAAASVPQMLQDWNRVLQTGGTVMIIVPELEACMRNFLEAPESEKWGFRIEYIYGGQDHQVGQQLHKTGFTPPRLQSLMEAAGFVVDKIQLINNGLNDCIQLSAHKK